MTPLATFGQMKDKDDQAGDAELHFGSLQNVLGYHATRTASATRDAFTTHVGEPLNLRPVEYSVLMVLQANPGVAAKRVAQVLAIAPPNMTLLLDRLEERGWLQRERNPRDRRSQQLRLTAAGEALADRAERIAQTMEEALLEPLSLAERAMLIELMEKVYLGQR
jgi:DNA-binding MarR family transcriptional regulator